MFKMVVSKKNVHKKGNDGVDMICNRHIKLNPCGKCGYQPINLVDSIGHSVEGCKLSKCSIGKSSLVSGENGVDMICIGENCTNKPNKNDVIESVTLHFECNRIICKRKLDISSKVCTDCIRRKALASFCNVLIVSLFVSVAIYGGLLW